MIMTTTIEMEQQQQERKRVRKPILLTCAVTVPAAEKIEVASERDEESHPERAMIVRLFVRLLLRLFRCLGLWFYDCMVHVNATTKFAQKSQSLSHLFVFLLLLPSKTGFVS